MPLAQVLLRLSRHLSLLASRAHGLENALGTLSREVPNLSNDMNKRLQDADFIRQSIDDLCILTHLLASREDSGDLTRADGEEMADALRLCATRMLLDVGPFSSAPPEDAQRPGDTLLF